MENVINQKAWLPAFKQESDHIYILLTSLNLGGAEKIVSDQLWANYYQKAPHKVTLFVIYDKHKEHSIPPNVNIVRLNNKIENGELLFKQVAFEGKPLVCHLINDKLANYLFSLGLNIHLVIHNDKMGWVNTKEVFDHPQVISLISICNYVTKQLKEVTDKNIFTVRHQISYKHFQFNPEMREHYRREFNIKSDDILIGMTGRICNQKNYFLALDVIAYLSRINPKYKLVILGGFEQSNMPVYFDLLRKSNKLQIQKNVIIPGFKEKAFEVLNAFDIALNVSHFEGLSMATQEFMMNGLNVVLSNVSGQPEIFDNSKQLKFFDFPASLNNIESHHLSLDDENNPEYNELVIHIANLIMENHSVRNSFNEEQKQLLNHITYGSHNTWSLFNFITNKVKNDSIKPAFLTSNLNLGGAQRSLVNLLVEMKENGVDIPLILLNQSNYTGFYKHIIDKQIEHYLCHSQNDVFVIGANLIKYIFENEINRIVLWNVDSKVKLLLSKLVGHYVDIIDVSPGDYCFNEMDNQIAFQEAIYYKKEDYFSGLNAFVSKFDNSHLKQDYKKYLNKETFIVPNGVPVDARYFNQHKNTDIFKFLVCGRITESKHVDLILSAFTKMYETNKNITIDLYGSAESYNVSYYEMILSKYSSLIENAIINFKGNIDDPREIMKDYHAIIVLGTHQGSPNMVLESAVCKLPCITNDSGGTKEVINNNTGVLLAEMPNEDALLESMVKTVRDYPESLQKADLAYQHVVDNFSMTTMFKRYMNIIYTP